MNKHLTEIIANRLLERGFDVKCNIGTSNFKIDIGVIHPKKPEKYILGIFLDGHYYYNTLTTSDRELVTPTVLKSLGWNLFRVWSLDWYENPEKIINDIDEMITNLLNENLIDNPKIEDQEDDTFSFLPNDIEEMESVPTSTEVEALPSKIRIYNSHQLEPIQGAQADDIFFDTLEVKDQIEELVNKEWPISKNRLFKKVVNAWGLTRVGARLESYLVEVVNSMGLVSSHHYQTFYWPVNSMKELDYYRENESDKRNMEDIAPEEISVVIEEILLAHHSIQEDELIRHLAKVFGFSKVGKQIDSILRYTIDFLELERKIEKINGRIKLAESNS